MDTLIPCDAFSVISVASEENVKVPGSRSIHILFGTTSIEFTTHACPVREEHAYMNYLPCSGDGQQIRLMFDCSVVLRKTTR